MNKFYNFISNEQYQKILLIIGFITTFTILHQGAQWFMTSVSKDITVKLDTVDIWYDQQIESPVKFDTLYNNRLKNQYYSSKELKRYFFTLAVIFNNNYYKFSICFIVSTILLSVATFLMVQRGWNGSSLILKEFFIICVFTSSLYYFMPLVFNNQENLQKNIDKVKIYNGIQLDILNYQIAFDTLSRFRKDTVLANINNRIKNNYDILLSIDPSKVKITPLESLEKISSGNGK